MTPAARPNNPAATLREQAARAAAEAEGCGPWSADCNVRAGVPCNCARTADAVVGVVLAAVRAELDALPGWGGGASLDKAGSLHAHPTHLAKAALYAAESGFESLDPVAQPVNGVVGGFEEHGLDASRAGGAAYGAALAPRRGWCGVTAAWHGVDMGAAA